MAEPMYFQWQNKSLLKTIYPRRSRKLADFLIYCKEMDLWQEYKDKDIADLGEEVKTFIAEREDAVIKAYKAYRVEYDYFTRGDVRTRYMPKYRLSDEAELAPIKELHRVFADSLPKRQDVRREKNLVAYYVSVWEQRVKKLKEEEARLARRLQIIHPDHRDRPVLTQQLQRLRDVTMPMIGEELTRLVHFVSTYNKIEKRKLEFYKARESAKTTVHGLRTKLDGVRLPLKRLEAECWEISTVVERLKTPPQRDAFEGYFLTEEISDELCREFPDADPTLIDVLTDIHKRLAIELNALKGDDVRRVTLRNYVDKLRVQYTALLTEVSRLEAHLRTLPGDAEQGGEKHARVAMLKGAGLKAVEMELDRLIDYHAVFEYANKPLAEMTRMIQEKEREFQQKQERISQLERQAIAFEEELSAKESILHMEEVDYLVRFVPDQPITVKDIVRGKVEIYKASLEERIDEQKRPVEEIQQELLEEIVRRFIQEPREFPLWLQYMVIHFSGMRYASAHGTWADPKDLLSSLRASELEKVFKGWDDDAVEALCEERLAAYESPDPARAPGLALATDRKLKEQIATHLGRLKMPHRRREALFELLLDEENYEIESMDPAQALEGLEAMHAKDPFPQWMWKEIVRLTELRVKEVRDENWSTLTQEEQNQKNEALYAEFRAIMNDWKQKHLTGWREEHDRSNRLIVASSVCNEVAEQIQHLRGNTPPGGLTSKPDWYMNTEGQAIKRGKSSGPPGPYFARAKPGAEKYFTEGASILWLRFVHEVPNQWRVAKPLVTRQGDRLIPDEYRNNKAPEAWQYFESDVIKRTRQRVVDKKKFRDQQWLRWMHEATIAKVTETADGPTVLTFETALPTDDRRVSAVGVFKHGLNRLMWDGGEDNFNGAFIGYIPAGEIPVSDLEDMLDWNKILRRQVMTPSQLEDYRKKYIRRS